MHDNPYTPIDVAALEQRLAAEEVAPDGHRHDYGSDLWVSSGHVVVHSQFCLNCDSTRNRASRHQGPVVSRAPWSAWEYGRILPPWWRRLAAWFGLDA